MFPAICFGENKLDWVFDQERNVATVTTKQVVNDSFPILSVVHYSDDHSWGFYCGTTNKSEDLMLVRMGEVIDTDLSLNTIADLPPGWSAYRESVKHKWVRSKGE